MRTALIAVFDMDFSGCSNVVQRALVGVRGVRSAQVSFDSGIATVEYDECHTSPDKLKLAIMSAGYGVEPVTA